MPPLGQDALPKYVEGCERGERPADPDNWRVAKSIFVADDLATAKAYATDPAVPMCPITARSSPKLKKNGRIELFKSYHDQPRTRSRWRASATSS